MLVTDIDGTIEGEMDGLAKRLKEALFWDPDESLITDKDGLFEGNMDELEKILVFVFSSDSDVMLVNDGDGLKPEFTTG